jgi:hypothetical protein
MQPLARETEVLLLCASQRLSESAAARVGELCRAERFRWGGMYRAAVCHQIAGLVLPNLLKIDAAARRMPPAIAERWKRQRIRNMLVKKNQARVIREIVEFFAKRPGPTRPIDLILSPEVMNQHPGRLMSFRHGRL